MLHQRFRKGNTIESYHFSGLDFETSKAVRAGNLVFLQGQTGITPDGKDFAGGWGLAAQAENAAPCVRALLDEAGARMEDFCKIATYITEHSYRELV